MKNATQYNITDAARELGVTRQTIYYWIKKGWVSPKRDYRGYPVFTRGDIGGIKKWYNTLREPLSPSEKPAKKKSDSVPPPNWKWQDLQNSLYK